MTSAPMSPRICVQKGPATFCVRSATITPSSGGRTAGSLSPHNAWWRGVARGQSWLYPVVLTGFRCPLLESISSLMALNTDELAQRLASLSERFAHLAQSLSQSAQLAQSGAPPAESLIDEITSIRTEFVDVRQRVVEVAKALSVNAPGMAEIDSLKALKTVVDAVAKGIADQEKKAALAEARTKVMTVLDRILAISHVDGPNFTSLMQCQAKAREIRQAAQDPGAFDSENAPAFLESTPSFAALLTMIENRDALDDDKFAALEDAVTQSFGKTLAVAATRGKLVVGAAPASAAERPAAAAPRVQEPSPRMATPAPAVQPQPSPRVAAAPAAAASPAQPATPPPVILGGLSGGSPAARAG